MLAGICGAAVALSHHVSSLPATTVRPCLRGSAGSINLQYADGAVRRALFAANVGRLLSHGLAQRRSGAPTLGRAYLGCGGVSGIASSAALLAASAAKPGSCWSEADADVDVELGREIWSADCCAGNICRPSSITAALATGWCLLAVMRARLPGYGMDA